MLMSFTLGSVVTTTRLTTFLNIVSFIGTVTLRLMEEPITTVHIIRLQQNY